MGLHFWGRTWSLAGWCHLRRDWRGFRIDRMSDVAVLEETFDPTERGGLDAYLEHVRNESVEEGYAMPRGLG